MGQGEVAVTGLRHGANNRVHFFVNREVKDELIALAIDLLNIYVRISKVTTKVVHGISK